LEFSDVFRCAFGDEASAMGAGIGPEVDDPIGAFDHIEIVFDHQQRVSGIDEFLKHAEQAFDVGEVETGGGFVEDEKFCALRRRRRFAQKLAKFQALRLAAGKRVERLAKLQVAEADLDQRSERSVDFFDQPRFGRWGFGCEGKCLRNFGGCELEHIGNR
jgi:hypothetical protein